MKEKLRSYSFWVAIISAVMALLQTIGAKIDIPHLNEIMTACLGFLAVSGIIQKPKTVNKNNSIDKIGSEENKEIDIAEHDENITNNDDDDIEQA